MARTHFDVVRQRTDGNTLEFIARFRENSATGPFTTGDGAEQTLRVPIAATQAEQIRAMADAALREVTKGDRAAAAPLVVNGTTIAIAPPSRTSRETTLATFATERERRRRIVAAVAEGVIASNDAIVTAQLTALTTALTAVRALTGPALTANEVLDLL